MTRVAPCIASSGLAVASWLGMQIVHECGHAVGAWLTDGRVVRVVLHPLAISRTDVNPNPVPAVVVWLGPIAGCCLPILTACLLTQIHRCNAMHATAKLWQRASSMGWFFAGFCLIANGAYLVFGTLDRVGDCGEMLRTGTPAWAIYSFGTLAIVLGFSCWQQLGSFRDWFNSQERSQSEAVAISVATMLLVALEVLLTA